MNPPVNLADNQEGGKTEDVYPWVTLPSLREDPAKKNADS